MEKMRTFVCIFFLSTALLAACKKNAVEEQFTETINPVIPDFATQVNTSVNGFITDENDNAVAGASVIGGAITVITDQFGYFKISTAAFAKTAGFVQVTKPGYFTGYRTFLPIEGKTTFIRLQLIPKTNAGNVEAATGGTITTTDGAKITIPANAVVVAANNAAYTGMVAIAAHWLNPSAVAATQLTMPGDLRGIDSSGYLKALITYGMLAVELTGSGGEKLQIAPGKKATLSFPIPAAIAGTAPAAIPLWYFDETKGLWKQEGNAVKNGSNYEGVVSHFSFWNADVALGLVNFTTQLVDAALNPISNIALSISIAGQPNSARISYTDANGFVVGMIPANSSIVMNVISACNTTVFTQNISTTNSAVDLGALVINMPANLAIFSGTVNKCSGSPVTDGYVVIAGGGYNHVINVVSGSFNATQSVCPGTTATVVAIDRETAQQSNPQNIIQSTGANNLGIFSACNTATETITCLFDGVLTTYSLPQYLFNANYDLASDSTDIKTIDLLNANRTVFRIGGIYGNSPGAYPIYYLYFSDRNYFFISPTNVTITAYGLVGNFINGHFSGTVKDNINNTNHSIECNFQVKRDL